MRRAMTLLLTLAVTTAGFAQTTNTDWLLVKNLNYDTAVEVKTTKGKTYKGAFLSADNESLTMMTTRRTFLGRTLIEIRLDRPEVRQVRLVHPNASTAAGAAIGGTAGGVAFYAMDRRGSDMRGVAAASGAFLGAMFGSIIGRGTMFVKGAVVYRAP